MADTAFVATFLSALMVIGSDRKASAAQLTEHPFIAPDDIKSETCLTCHPNKAEGRFVHTVLKAGCENCHHTVSENDRRKTTVTLVAVGGDLCSECHAASRAPVQHGPYKARLCLICHEPHSSDFAKQTRAETNILCSSCHDARPPDVRIDAANKSVTLLGGRTFDLAAYEKAPKIKVTHAKANAAYAAGQAIRVEEAKRHDGEPGCLDCHVPHAGQAEHLLRGAAKRRGGDEGPSSHQSAGASFIGGRQ
ncbi:MAG: cytochrome c3 family protein [Terriglobia bacterium]